MVGQDAASQDVVLLDESGRELGVAAKADVHHEATPLHLAFSCYVADRGRHLLLTQRSPAKLTWPSVWTNSCCGHPQPGEDLADAVTRRLHQELGATPVSVDLVLPRFRYRAVMSNGMVENEICPVFRAEITGALDPDPAEVADIQWVPWETFRADVLCGVRVVSPWCRQQVVQLAELPPDPFQWPIADPAELSHAARQSWRH